LLDADDAFAEAYDAGNVGTDRKLASPPAIGTDHSRRSNLDEALAFAYWTLAVCLPQDTRPFAEGTSKLLAL